MQLIIVIKHAPQVLDRRTAVFPKLLSLNGRLELALAQLSRDDPQESTLPSATYDEEVEDAVDEHDDLAAKYYNGFSNGVLWPLFHYVPLPMYKAGSERKFDMALWKAYKEANKLFADAVLTLPSAIARRTPYPVGSLRLPGSRQPATMQN